jgi:enoyl-CoA hydratase/carnithine racemase
MTFDIFSAPMPTISVMAGHAVGGGNILALTCDFRYGTAEKRLIGLNEVKMGLPVPYLADLILRQLVGDRAANKVLYHGELMTMSEAQQIGMVDEAVSPEKLEEVAREKMTGLVSLPRSGFSAIKANRNESITARYLQNQEAKRKVFLDNWFDDSIQEMLREASKKF